MSFVHICFLLIKETFFLLYIFLGGGGEFFSLQNYAMKDNIYVNLCSCLLYRMELNNLFLLQKLFTKETESQKVNFQIQKQRCDHYCLMIQQSLLVLCIVFLPCHQKL